MPHNAVVAMRGIALLITDRTDLQSVRPLFRFCNPERQTQCRLQIGTSGGEKHNDYKSTLVNCNMPEYQQSMIVLKK